MPVFAKRIFIFLFLLPAIIQAQRPHIAKDNVTCIYGLKNKSGTWLVEPQFTRIDSTSLGYFIVYAGEKQGIYTPAGKKILDPLYESISAWPDITRINRDHDHSYSNKQDSLPHYAYFIIQKDNTYGVCDTNGQITVPCKWSSIAADNSSHVIFTDEKLKGRMDIQGHILLPAKYTTLGTFENRNVAMATFEKESDGYGEEEYYKEAGVINEKGETIVPFQYGSIDFMGHNRIRVSKKEKVGFYDYSGKLLLDNRYDLSRRAVSRQLSSEPDHGLLITGTSKHHRLIRYDQNSMQELPGEYDSVFTHHRYYDGMRHEAPPYITLYRKKYSLLGNSGEVLLPADYDELSAIIAKQKNAPGMTLYFMGHARSGYGLFDSHGKAIYPCGYDACMQDNEGHDKLLLLAKGRNIVLVDLQSANADSCTHVERITELNDTTSLFSCSTGDFVFVFHKAGKPEQLTGFSTGASYFGSRIERFSGGAFVQLERTSCFLLDRNLKLLLSPKQVRFIYINHERNTATVYTTSKKAGLFDLNSGQWILDTIYAAIHPLYYYQRDYWVKFADSSCAIPTAKDLRVTSHTVKGKPVRDTTYITNPCYCGWMVVKAGGEPRFNERFSIPFPATGGVQAVWGNTGAGVFDCYHDKYIIPPIYADIITLDRRNFATVTRSGKIGIIDISGNVIADTLWKSIEPLYTAQLTSSDGRRQTASRINHLPLWLLRNGKKKAVAGYKLYTGAATVDSMRRQAFLPSEQEQGWYPLGRGAPALSSLNKSQYYDEATVQLLLNHAATSAIAYHDQLAPFSVEEKLDTYCNCAGPEEENWQDILNDRANKSFGITNRVTYEITFAGNYGYSLSISNHNGSEGWKKPKRLHENFRLAGHTITPLFLRDVINGDTTRIFNDLLLNAIRENEQLKINCSDNSRLFEMTRGNFSLSDNGLVFYFEQASTWNNTIEVPVTLNWKTIVPFAKPGSIVFDFIKGP